VVLDVVADSRGFVWLDGSEFWTYTTDEGLPNPVVNRILERTAGEHWVGTNGGGVCQLHTAVAGTAEPDDRITGAPRSLFTCCQVGDNFLSNRVNDLLAFRPEPSSQTEFARRTLTPVRDTRRRRHRP
jgi:hypothetical protein